MGMVLTLKTTCRKSLDASLVTDVVQILRKRSVLSFSYIKFDLIIFLTRKDDQLPLAEKDGPAAAGAGQMAARVAQNVSISWSVL